MKIAIFMDGANFSDMAAAYNSHSVQGFTTNPTLMMRAGVYNYESFARMVLAVIPDLPVSFEVIADDLPTMKLQARQISSWGSNVYVKIPVMTTEGISTEPIIRELTADGIKLNVTAVMTVNQVMSVIHAVEPHTPTIISVFAGRIADTGHDPVPTMRMAVGLCRNRPELKILWASPREVLNIYEAEECKCHIITATPDIIAKLSLKDKDLHEFSKETVKMFYDDAKKAGLSL